MKCPRCGGRLLVVALRGRDGTPLLVYCRLCGYESELSPPVAEEDEERGS